MKWAFYSTHNQCFNLKILTHNALQLLHFFRPFYLMTRARPDVSRHAFQGSQDLCTRVGQEISLTPLLTRSKSKIAPHLFPYSLYVLHANSMSNLHITSNSHDNIWNILRNFRSRCIRSRCPRRLWCRHFRQCASSTTKTWRICRATTTTIRITINSNWNGIDDWIEIRCLCDVGRNTWAQDITYPISPNFIVEFFYLVFIYCIVFFRFLVFVASLFASFTNYNALKKNKGTKKIKAN